MPADGPFDAQGDVPALPRLPGLDQTLALRREGYAFISRRCDLLGSDGFRTRLMLRDVVCLRGPEASALFYNGAPPGDAGSDGPGARRGDDVTRVGAMPRTVLWLLQDKGSVQQLDGPAHRRRKEMFVHLAMAPDAVADLVAEFRAAWLDALPGWQRAGSITLMPALAPVLTRAVCRWAGIDLDDRATARLARALFAMSDHSGGIGPAMWLALARRAAVERWLRARIRQQRGGDRPAPHQNAPPGSALARIARAADASGPLPLRIAAIELLNVLRPVVAIGRYIAFAALALHQSPDWAARFRAGDDSRLTAFAEELRRHTPFFPFVGGIATRPLVWRGQVLPKGQWLLLDLYGTTHDGRLFPDPGAILPARGLSWRDQDHAFIPQGGGRVESSHRCPGERITVAVLAEAIRLLCTAMDYDVPAQSLTVRLDRIPAQPDSGMVLSGLRQRPPSPPA